eukprot:CAMPEP_0115021904 /NCGR_PEP_ID=MMETSP0216-20121206/31190_1 /TAXON_ID=223996 /ORGANISM="Protocruzia adherens, Strain Boccale" /LENGTH=742 /DNA_ID=CAMNT_0002394401 /DNA_START=63 /DNA_END=2291 /DNA_ORIENTATION=+
MEKAKIAEIKPLFDMEAVEDHEGRGLDAHESLLNPDTKMSARPTDDTVMMKASMGVGHGGDVSVDMEMEMGSMATESMSGSPDMGMVGGKMGLAMGMGVASSARRLLPKLDVKDHEGKSLDLFSKGFEVLRYCEYDEYLLEMQATRNKKKKHVEVAPQIDMSFEEFLKSKKFLNEERYMHTFKVGVFLRYLVAHFMFFLLGPFSLPFLLPFYGRHDMHNMGFISINRVAMYQYISWFTFAIPSVWWILYPDCGIFPTEIQALLVNIVFRSFVIAVRYAYATDSLLFVQKHISMKMSDIEKDFAIVGWQKLSDRAIEKELEISMLRQKIDQDFFNLQFAEPIEDTKFSQLLLSDFTNRDEFKKCYDTTAKIVAPHKRGENLLANNSRRRPENRANQVDMKVAAGQVCKNLMWPTVKGKNFAREMIAISRDVDSSEFKVFSIYMIVILMIPTFFRLGAGTAPFGDHIYEWPIFVCIFISSYLYNRMNLFFINLAYSDSERRLFLMRCLSGMISVHRDYTFKYLHLTPLVDIYNPACLEAWYMMRTILTDVGKRFSDKIYTYFSVLLVGYALLSIWFVLVVLGFVKLRSLDVGLQAVMVGNIIVMVFIYIAMILVNGAEINEHFKTHRDLLMKNKTHYTTVALCKEELDNSIRYVNPMLSLAAQKIVCMGNKALDFDELLRKLELTTESIYEKLVNDEIKNPYKLVGVKVDWPLIGQLATLIASLVGFIIQYYTGIFRLKNSSVA